LQSSRSSATQVASGNYSVITGGVDNTASGVYSVVGGGYVNTASAQYSVVGGGAVNTASAHTSVVGGGGSNTASGIASFVGGGYGNTASEYYSVVGGGWVNTASGYTSVVGGGWINTASEQYSVVGGGAYNAASGSYSVVGGGAYNAASGSYSVVGGGFANVASGGASFVGGGAYNTASGDYSAIPGGHNLRVGDRSFGFSGQTSTTQTNLSAYSNIAAFVDVDLWLYNVRNQASQLRLYEPSGSGTNFTAFRARAQASDIIYTLPASLTPTTTVGTGILQTDASGNLSWVSPSALVGGSVWLLSGNSGTTPWNGTTGNFLGTTDTSRLIIATTNTTTPRPIELWVGNQQTLILNPPGTTAPGWSIQRGGGNTRGLHAVDLQSYRLSATQVASGDYSVIAGGQNNTASGNVSVVGGGEWNTASGSHSVVGGGWMNTASGYRSVVGGGYGNTASGLYNSFVGGGYGNTASGWYSVVGGGDENTASGYASVVGGGDGNTASGDDSFVGGGYRNTASGQSSVVGGGSSNTASGRSSVVGGGGYNTASGGWSFVGGGLDNTASGGWSFVGGGELNTASGGYSAIPGGYNLRVGERSFGFSGQTSETQTDLSAASNIAAFVDVDLWLYNVRNQASQLRLYEPSGSGTNFTAFRARAQASDIVYTLPASLTPTTTVGTGILQTDASGNLSWLDPSALGGGGGSGWSLTGNSGTNPATNFLGTTDAQPLVIKVNNQETFRFNAPGTTAPGWSIQRGGGNTRGLHAVDLQSSRSSATQVASGNYSVITGGIDNTASGWGSVVGGGSSNTASGIASFVGGGYVNTASAQYSVVGGGTGNTASGYTSVVGGGSGNTASEYYSVVGGGQANTASGYTSVVGGGYVNTASGVYSVVGGGFANVASGGSSFVGGGAYNTASGAYSAIPGGFNLTVGDRSFGFSGQTTWTETDLSDSSNIAAFVDVDLWLYNVRDQASQLRLYEPSGSGTNFTAFRAQAQASDIIYTLPASLTPTTTVAAGILQTDASGNLSWLDPSALGGGGGSGWSLTGNSGTNPSTNFLGTTDNQPLVIRVWGQETFRFNAPGSSAPGWSIQRGGGNTRGLHAVDLQSSRSDPAQVASGDYSVIVGGYGNTASGYTSVVGGGLYNTSSGSYSVVGGGDGNTASGSYSFVGGGVVNTASGSGSFVGGGDGNTASGLLSVVGGGRQNNASGYRSVVGGGYGNTASGAYSAIPGGFNLTVGARSFGFSGQTSTTQTDLSDSSNIAAFVDVNLWLYNVDNSARQLRLYEPSGAGRNFTAFRAQAQASDIIYTLPASLTPTTTVGTGILQTDASGNLSWLDPSALGGGGGGGSGWSLTGNGGTNPATNFLGTTDAQPLVIKTDGEERMRIDAAGNVGIGTSNPQHRLHVHGSEIAITNSSTGSTATDGFLLKLEDTKAVIQQRENDDILFRTPAGSDSVKMRLTADGSLRFFGTGGSYRVDLPNNSGIGVGRIRANSFVQYSSLRWKEEVRPIENALDKVMRLRGIAFRWKPEYGGTPDIGFAMEEVNEVLPEIVDKDPRTGELLGMDYSRVTSVLVEGLKQHIREQERENAELRARLERLESLVEQLLQERGNRGSNGGSSGVEIHDAWLGQNIPNPFEGTTTIPYYIPAGVGRAELVVRDLGGRELRRVELPERGAHGQVTVEMRLLGSGTYEYALVLDGRVVAVKQMTLLR
jgi:hypothetical protein